MRNRTLAGDEVPPGSAVYHTQREQAGVAIEVRCRTRSERTSWQKVDAVCGNAADLPVLLDAATAAKTGPIVIAS
jgi:hypothetical protein